MQNKLNALKAVGFVILMSGVGFVSPAVAVKCTGNTGERIDSQIGCPLEIPLKKARQRSGTVEALTVGKTQLGSIYFWKATHKAQLLTDYNKLKIHEGVMAQLDGESGTKDKPTCRYRFKSAGGKLAEKVRHKATIYCFEIERGKLSSASHSGSSKNRH